MLAYELYPKQYTKRQISTVKKVRHNLIKIWGVIIILLLAGLLYDSLEIRNIHMLDIIITAATILGYVGAVIMIGVTVWSFATNRLKNFKGNYLRIFDDHIEYSRTDSFAPSSKPLSPVESGCIYYRDVSGLKKGFYYNVSKGTYGSPDSIIIDFVGNQTSQVHRECGINNGTISTCKIPLNGYDWDDFWRAYDIINNFIENRQK